MDSTSPSDQQATASAVAPSAHEEWTVEKIEGGHAILFSADARACYPHSFNIDEVIEWEHDCIGKQARDLKRRLNIIAAAPDLLAALKALLDWSSSEYQSNPKIDALAKAAIAKAEGR